MPLGKLYRAKAAFTPISRDHIVMGTAKPVVPNQLPITTIARARFTAPKQERRFFPSTSCKHLYFLFIGLITGTMLGVLLSRNAEFDYLASNKCIIPCDRLLNEFESHLKISMDKESKIVEKAFYDPAAAVKDLEEAMAPTAVKTVSDVEFVSDIVPIPIAPFEGIQTDDKTPSAMDLKFTKLFSSAFPGVSFRKPAGENVEDAKDIKVDDNKAGFKESAHGDDNGGQFFSTFEYVPNAPPPMIPFGDNPSLDRILPGILSRIFLNTAFPAESSGDGMSGEEKPAMFSDPNIEVIKLELGPIVPAKPEAPVNPAETAQAQRAAEAQAVESMQSQPVESKAAKNFETFSGQSEEAAPVEVQPAEPKPVQVQPAEPKPVAAQPQPAEPKPFAAQSAEARPIAAKPVEATKTPETYDFYISYPEDKATWFEAFAKCAARDMELISLQTAEKSNAIEQSLSLVAGTETLDHFWTSGTNLLAENWSNYNWGTTGEPITFSKLIPNEEARLSKNDNQCIGVKRSLNAKGAYVWTREIACNVASRYICQEAKKAAPASTTGETVPVVPIFPAAPAQEKAGPTIPI